MSMQRWSRYWVAVLAAFSLLAPLQDLHAQRADTGRTQQRDVTRWENAIAKIEASSNREPGGIVFTGSSSIARWTTLAQDFPGLPVRNHGFGGSIVSEVTHFVDRIVVPFKPRMVVFYAGDNDLGMGRTPEQVAADFQAFFAAVRKSLPQAKIAFISIKPSILRANLFEQMKASNTLIKAWLGRQQNAAYIDVFTPMLDEKGAVRTDLFVADNLHMNPTGYAIWTRVVGPYLK
jgi:lysophospholipase L1-like esterase